MTARTWICYHTFLWWWIAINSSCWSNVNRIHTPTTCWFKTMALNFVGLKSGLLWTVKNNLLFFFFLGVRILGERKGKKYSIFCTPFSFLSLHSICGKINSYSKQETKIFSTKSMRTKSNLFLNANFEFWFQNSNRKFKFSLVKKF